MQIVYSLKKHDVNSVEQNSTGLNHWLLTFVLYVSQCLYDSLLLVEGFCGADLKALCTEAALLALRRRYPQIYNSSEKLQIDVSSISVNAKDFHGAMKAIVPASQRSVSSPARALSNQVAPLLQALFNEILSALDSIYPSVLMQLSNLDSPGNILVIDLQQ